MFKTVEEKVIKDCGENTLSDKKTKGKHINIVGFRVRFTDEKERKWK